MKKLAITLSVLLFLILTGCSINSKTPEKAIDNFFLATKELNIEQIKQVINEETKENIKTKFQYNTEQETLLGTRSIDGVKPAITIQSLKGFSIATNNIKKLLSEIKYKIVDVNYNESHSSALVDIQITRAVGGDIMIQTFNGVFNSLIESSLKNEKINDEDILNIILEVFNEKFKSYETKLTIDTISIELHKNDNDDWIIQELTEETLNSLSFGALNALDKLGLDTN